MPGGELHSLDTHLQHYFSIGGRMRGRGRVLNDERYAYGVDGTGIVRDAYGIDTAPTS